MIIGASVIALLVLTIGTIFFPQNIVMTLADTSTHFLALRITLLITIFSLVVIKILQIKISRLLLAMCALTISFWALFNLYTYSIHILDFMSLVLVALAFIAAIFEQPEAEPKEEAKEQ